MRKWIVSLSTILSLFACSVQAYDCGCFLNCGDYLECGDVLVRARAIGVFPSGSSGHVNTIPDSKVKVSNAWTGEVDFTYMWTRHIGTELILAATEHEIKGAKALNGTKIGNTWVLPPTLTVQYHFMPDYNLQPYVGVGVNYTLFFNKHCSIDDTKLNLSNSWGAAFQAGVDYFFNECWFVNVDAKYIFMETKAHLRGAVEGHVHVDIDPWVVGIGIGRRF